MSADFLSEKIAELFISPCSTLKDLPVVVVLSLLHDASTPPELLISPLSNIK